MIPNTAIGRKGLGQRGIAEARFGRTVLAHIVQVVIRGIERDVSNAITNSDERSSGRALIAMSWLWEGRQLLAGSGSC